MGFARMVVPFCSRCGCKMDELNAGAPMRCGSLDDNLFLVIMCAECQADDVVEICRMSIRDSSSDSSDVPNQVQGI